MKTASGPALAFGLHYADSCCGIAGMTVNTALAQVTMRQPALLSRMKTIFLEEVSLGKRSKKAKGDRGHIAVIPSGRLHVALFGETETTGPCGLNRRLMV